MYKVIGGKRYCGKTTNLIKQANKEWLYIVSPNKDMARNTLSLAKGMGLDIPHPITPEELVGMTKLDGFLIDEVEMVLFRMFGNKVLGMSTSMEFEELNSLKDESLDSNETKEELNTDKLDYLLEYHKELVSQMRVKEEELNLDYLTLKKIRGIQENIEKELGIENITR